MPEQFHSPDLYDGVEASSVECDKNNDGTLDCVVNKFATIETSRATKLDEVRIIADNKARHMGPRDEEHVVVEFNQVDVSCYLTDRHQTLECSEV